MAVVESEKSAIICSAIYPDYIWLASGGRNGLNADKVKTLQGRTVVLIPDADSFEYWSTEATKYKAVCNVSTSQYIEDIATDEERQQGADIADYLIWIRQSAFEYCK